MKRRFTEEQIIGILREQEAGGRCCQVKANGPPKTVEPASSGRQLAPLGQGGGTVLSEDVAAIEVTVLIEMIVD